MSADSAPHHSPTTTIALPWTAPSFAAVKGSDLLVLGLGYRLQETSGLSRAAPILAGRLFFEEQALELLAASIGPKFATAN
jgi:hypothetical protein